MTHKVWTVSDSAKIESIAAVFETEIPFTYIADGHHRTASAAKVGRKMRDHNANHTGHEEYNYFLSVLFPDEQLAIMDYNRLVKDLNGFTPEVLLQKLQESFSITKCTLDTAKPKLLHDFAMYLNGQWYNLKANAAIVKQDTIGVLDVTILQENVLAPLLGVEDPRTNKRIDFVGGIRGFEELQKRVDAGDSAVAFALFPVSLRQLMDIADSGQVMPPKSTWFEPKLRDGLFCHLF